MSARVLVVDDIPVNVKLLEARLALEYYEVLSANDGKTALEIARTQQPDIILLDVMMPDMDGYEVCTALKTDPVTAHIPVVMVTALDATGDRVQGLEAGADDFLSKPVNDTALFARISSLVRLNRACDEWRARYESRLRQTYVASVNAAVTDALTGLYNRRYLESHFGRLQERLKSSSKRVAALLIDIDRFKSVNDTYGHEAGDVVLRGASNLLRENLRGFDTAVRLGGEEFVVIMPDCSDHVAGLAAERLRRTVEASRFDLPGVEEPLALTISIGVATAVAGEQDLDGLLRAADQAVYSAKEQGRNCVVVSGEDAPAPPKRAIA